ncbi:hypothetical protein [Kitasatospora sp. NBC_01266]|uniref:hypothetical protein n=1 Tax=Kitasatospora sp. NBC_01266 TaxID=2903572 RepID=UPI002E32B4E5|nr:hypothetical protein [Kitasatospora sp. NBC_01266]
MAFGERTPVRWSRFQRCSAWVGVAAALVVAVAGGLIVWSWALGGGLLDDRVRVLGGAAAVALLSLLPVRRDAQTPLALLGAAVLLPVIMLTVAMSAKITQGISDWVATPESVPATVTGCHKTGTEAEDDDRAGINIYDVFGCTYHWSVNGQTYAQERQSADGESHPDGYRTRVWADGATGAVAEHDPLSLAVLGMFTLGGVAVSLLGCAVALSGLHDTGLMSRQVPDARGRVGEVAAGRR